MTLGLGVHPKILKIYLGVPPKIFKTVGVSPGAAKGSRRIRPAPLHGAGKSPLRHQATLPLVSKFWGEPLRKFSKFLGVPHTPNHKDAILLGEIALRRFLYFFGGRGIWLLSYIV